MSHDKYYRKYDRKNDWAVEQAPIPCPFGTTLKNPPVAFHVILHPFKSKYHWTPEWNFVGMYFSSSHDPADLSDIEHANMNGYEMKILYEMENITPKISYRFERLEGTSIATRYWPLAQGVKHHSGSLDSIAFTLTGKLRKMVVDLQ
jgi:hypothetical protein